MSRALMINLGLAALVVLLLAALFLFKPATEAEPARLAAGLERNTINRITVRRQGLDDLILEKQGADWFMRAPLAIRANPARVNTLLRLPDTESHAALDPAVHPPERFGLAEPAVMMTLNQHEFRFGGTEAIDRRRYILFRDRIHLTDDFLYPQLTANAAFFAELKLLPEAFNIAKIRFPGNELYKADGQWRLKTPLDISPGRLQRGVSAWRDAVAISAGMFEAPATPERISVIADNDQTLEFIIVATEPYLILGREALGIQFHMGGDEAEKLLLKENPPPVPKPE